MSFLDTSAREELQREASRIQRLRGEELSRQRKRMEEYYHRVLSLREAELPDGRRVSDWSAYLGENLRSTKGGYMRTLSPASRKKTLTALLKLERSSEMVFMSFFHSVCGTLRCLGGQVPRPSEIMEVQKLLFGRKCLTTCCHNVALLAYTLGYISEGDIGDFEKQRMAKTRCASQSTETPVEDQVGTTMLFEQYLDKGVHDLASFHQFFDAREKLVTEAEWKKSLRVCFQEIFSRHGGHCKSPTIRLEEQNCSHMEDTMQRRILNPEISEIPGREWFLEFALYMELQEKELNDLLRCCGYVKLGMEPWEVGLRYLLNNPADDLRTRLDRRESVFACFVEWGFQPPAGLFASFPYLTVQPGNRERELMASLFLDCFAEVQTGSGGTLYADFYEAPELPDAWRAEGPDFINIFSLKDGSTNFSTWFRRELGLHNRESLPQLERGSEDYQQLLEQARKWWQKWEPASPSAADEQALWGVPEDCGEGGARRRKFLYAVLLYTLYTGHLPMKGCRFPAHIPGADTAPRSAPLEFMAWDEGRACRNMAMSFLMADTRL